jgi:hypothetical protein
LITPPNGVGGGGSCFPSMVTVALGEPGTPVVSCAVAGAAVKNAISPSAPKMPTELDLNATMLIVDLASINRTTAGH